MAENEAEILAEEKSRIVLKGRIFHVGKFTLGQSIRLLKKLGKIFSVAADLKSRISEGMSNADALGVLFENLDDSQIAELVAIILKCDDLAFVQDLDIEESLDVVIKVCEMNDLSKLLKKAQTAMEKLGSALGSQKS